MCTDANDRRGKLTARALPLACSLTFPNSPLLPCFYVTQTIENVPFSPPPAPSTPTKDASGKVELSSPRSLEGKFRRALIENGDGDEVLQVTKEREEIKLDEGGRVWKNMEQALEVFRQGHNDDAQPSLNHGNSVSPTPSISYSNTSSVFRPLPSHASSEDSPNLHTSPSFYEYSDDDDSNDEGEWGVNVGVVSAGVALGIVGYKLMNA
ncbi:hypothetical protein TrVE_jg753 [Triparma verrucosa]|uniref:Uncharacterized protein n=1 Tax=Triparma verrucosa TaxID=1606542 RepID=A0A9W7FBZ3_9STRA|nr:hypothetical protein TrVE_jg753 [Triparma verrucosa]